MKRIIYLLILAPALLLVTVSAKVKDPSTPAGFAVDGVVVNDQLDEFNIYPVKKEESPDANPSDSFNRSANRKFHRPDPGGGFSEGDRDQELEMSRAF
jgi:hypothetical protein